MRTVRSECLDWLLILNDRHLAHVLAVFVEHYNGVMSHKSAEQNRQCTTLPRSKDVAIICGLQLTRFTRL